MIKQALKSAFYISIGVTIGRGILPRFIFPELYNDTYPPIWKYALLCFCEGFAASFAVYLAIGAAKNKLKK